MNEFKEIQLVTFCSSSTLSSITQYQLSYFPRTRSRAIWSASTNLPVSSIRILRRANKFQHNNVTDKINIQSFILKFSVVFDAWIDHGEWKDKTSRKKNPSGDQHIHIPFSLIINNWPKYKLIAAHGVLSASAPHAPAPPADCIDLSKFVFVKLQYKIQG